MWIKINDSILGWDVVKSKTDRLMDKKPKYDQFCLPCSNICLVYEKKKLIIKN